MKYYSEKTRKLYDEKKDLIEAEKQYDKAQEEIEKKEIEKKERLELLKKERSERAKEVEDAVKEADAAKEHATSLMNAFVKDYGAYHATFRGTTATSPLNLFLDLLSDFWI